MGSEGVFKGVLGEFWGVVCCVLVCCGLVLGVFEGCFWRLGVFGDVLGVFWGVLLPNSRVTRVTREEIGRAGNPGNPGTASCLGDLARVRPG